MKRMVTSTTTETVHHKGNMQRSVKVVCGTMETGQGSFMAVCPSELHKLQQHFNPIKRFPQTSQLPYEYNMGAFDSRIKRTCKLRPTHG